MKIKYIFTLFYSTAFDNYSIVSTKIILRKHIVFVAALCDAGNGWASCGLTHYGMYTRWKWSARFRHRLEADALARLAIATRHTGTGISPLFAEPSRPASLKRRVLWWSQPSRPVLQKMGAVVMECISDRCDPYYLKLWFWVWMETSLTAEKAAVLAWSEAGWDQRRDLLEPFRVDVMFLALASVVLRQSVMNYSKKSLLTAS